MQIVCLVEECIIEMHIVLSKVNQHWCHSIDSGVLLCTDSKCILLSPPEIISDMVLFFPCTLYSKTHFFPMFLFIRKRRKLKFWNKQFLYRESQGCTHIKAK